jgi:branched-chain amino acid transport system ATP-binding protein
MSDLRAPALLSVHEVSVRFGGLVALDRVSFDVPQGCVLGLIGPNGAGKTTLFNVITRIYRASGGGIRLQDRRSEHGSSSPSGPSTATCAAS